ncbi:hypothetical protein C0J52_23463 [Blattella germanica]|nr:hypothetical protein C0J52_23463 [Blattella germanica]
MFQNDGGTFNDEFGRKNCSGALLDMLAEVASQTLHSDPSVKSPVKRPAMRGSEISPHLSNKKKRATCRGRSGEGEVMDLDQLRSLNANHLVKLFSEFDGDEIRRTFTYTCFIEPEQCHQQFSSFGSEGKARQQMKSHLLEHVHQLEVKAERGCQFAIESMKVRRRRLAETLHVSRRLKNGSKIKVEPDLKSRPTDENDSSLPNKENTIASLSENCVVMKSIHKTERVANHETVENLNARGNGDDIGRPSSHCGGGGGGNVVVERISGIDEKKDTNGIYNEHNYVTFDMWGNLVSNVVTERDDDPKTESENETKPVGGLDLQKPEKKEDTKEEVMVCVVENDQLQLKQLPCVGQEVELNTSQLQSFKMIRSDDLPVVQDNRKAEPQDYISEIMTEINCEKNIERDEYVQKKKPKGKAKFIGQSKAEKEMAIQLIETMKKKGNTDSLECNICNPPRSFTAPTTLISHYRSHAGNTSY